MAGVHVEHPSDGVALVTMDDPDRRNAMTEQMGRDLATALAELGDDPALVGRRPGLDLRAHIGGRGSGLRLKEEEEEAES